MFNETKYTKIYFKIIDRAKTREVTGYSEKHHIIPKCLGGSDEVTNLVELTAREHFICHLLLPKMNSNRLLKYALVMMTVKNEYQINRYVPSSRIYELVKRTNSSIATKRMTGHYGYITGKKCYYNPTTGEEQFSTEAPEGWLLGSPKKSIALTGIHRGKVYYNNPETGQVISLSKNENPPEGFIKGNPKADSSDRNNIKNSKYYYNPVTGEEKRSHEAPSGWIKGRAVMFITNGSENKLIKKLDIIPDGWSPGRNMDWKRNMKRNIT